MNSLRFSSVVGVLTVLLAAQGWAFDTVEPEAAGLSRARLDRVEAAMQRHIDEGEFAGAVTLVARHGEIAYLNAQGVMDIESKRPMETDAVFRIMSMTKPVVAVAILMMVEEGKVRLTDPIAAFIPELGGLAVGQAKAPAERDITVLDLLTHTSGLMSGGASSDVPVAIGPDESLADVLPRLGDAPLDFQPGTQWAYSGQFGFDVLVRVVELTSGIDFGQFADERIFGPLGMNDTFFFPAGDHPRIATLYNVVNGQLEPFNDLAFVNGHYYSGGGGLFSTAEDYLRFATMLINDGEFDGNRLLGRRSVETMQSAFIPDTVPGRGAGEAYGLGVRVVTDPAARNTLLSKGSFGWSGAFNTHFFIDPTEELIGIFMTQSAFLATRQQVREDFETAVMQAIVD